MSLRDYVRKRRLGVTPEPGDNRRSARRGSRPIFVVQLHHARARHYDFRLEADGVLKSWAVPKGPSLRAGEKRLAVEVEDHPLAYAGFSGAIPQGHYGAGHVEIFDRGQWSSDDEPLAAIAQGKLDFALQGERLKGGFTLVRIRHAGRQPQWLLIKRSDRHARDADADALLAGPVEPQAPRVQPARRSATGTPAKAGAKQSAAAKAARGRGLRWHRQASALAGARARARMPDVELQLATLRRTPPPGDGWLHEVKWDGYRMLVRCEDAQVAIASRNGLPWTERLPAQVTALQALAARGFILDGELIALDEHGRSDFAELQRRLERGAVDELVLVFFDLLWIDGVDVRGSALRDRRELLRALLAEAGPLLAFSENTEGSAAQAFAASARAGLEGIVCKQADAPYAGGRAQHWIKLKHRADETFVVVGYTAPKGSRQGLGALLLAEPREGALHYAGRVGSGFDAATLAALTRRLRPLRQDAPTLALPAHTPLRASQVQWVRPQLEVDVHSRGRGKEGLVRQGSFVRVRDDRAEARLRTARPAATREASQLTHPERVVYPSVGLTKADVARYYRAVAPWLLTEIARRPLSVLRCPQGGESTCFFQKHHADGLGRHVHAVAVDARQGSDEYLYLRDERGLLELVQMNVIEFHPWGARVDDIERPDRVVFDLDPGDGVDWATVRAAAREIRDRLQELGLRSWPRLSGGKGIHVVVPFRRGPDWAQAKAFSEAFAHAMVQSAPLHYLATASKARRKGRIFIDWLRNARGATSVSGWSLRARAGAPVAMPVSWQALGRIDSAAAFDLERTLRRVGRMRAHPWQGFGTVRQRLPLD